MAGIGFTLKKLFQDESYINRSKAYLYSTLVAAGPWIITIITVNSIIFIMSFYSDVFDEKELFMGTIVYTFIFSQLITSPWQMTITRYIADKLYNKDYDYIRPSFVGLNKIVFFSSLSLGVLFYLTKPLPVLYKVMSIYLFVILSMIWILMVYLSAVKDYELIAKAYIYGGLISMALTIYLINNPLPFLDLVYSSNILFAYLIGLSVTFVLLIYNFLSTFYYGNYFEFDFLRYLDRIPSLFWISLLYTLGLWVDDILMWLSIAGVKVQETYQYAPIYDNAVFMAYLTTIPTSVLFLVSIETEFYDTYKKYYGLANRNGSLKEIDIASKEMKKTIWRKLFFTFQVQALISVTIVVFSKYIFDFLNVSILIRNIFRVCIFGALFNVFILIIILILLYFEARIRALLIAITFLVTNFTLTYYFANKGLEYYGYGFTLGALITFLLGVIIIIRFLKHINFRTFALQPLFATKDKGIFVWLADKLNKFKEPEIVKGELRLGKRHPKKAGKLYFNIGISIILIGIFFVVQVFPNIIDYTKSLKVFNINPQTENTSNNLVNNDSDNDNSNQNNDKDSEKNSSQNDTNDNEVNQDNKEDNKAEEVQYYRYVIKNGDTLLKIGDLFYNNKEMAIDIQKINDIEDVTNIFIGTVLLLPSNINNNEKIVIPSQPEHIIKLDETLYSISMQFYGHKGMTEDIKIANSIDNVNDIKVGTVIILPIENIQHRKYSQATLYKVQSGDTLFSICIKFYGSKDKLEELKKANNIADIYSIPVGKVLIIP